MPTSYSHRLAQRLHRLARYIVTHSVLLMILKPQLMSVRGIASFFSVLVFGSLLFWWAIVVRSVILPLIRPLARGINCCPAARMYGIAFKLPAEDFMGAESNLRRNRQTHGCAMASHAMNVQTATDALDAFSHAHDTEVARFLLR